MVFVIPGSLFLCLLPASNNALATRDFAILLGSQPETHRSGAVLKESALDACLSVRRGQEGAVGAAIVRNRRQLAVHVAVQIVLARST